MNYGTLRVKTPDGQVREYPLEVPSVVIGRAESNVVTIEHVSVSRRHAILRIAEDSVTIEDLGSGTGTYVTGSRVKPGDQVPVEPGSMVRIGEAEATYIAAPAAGDESEGGEPAGIARAAAPETEEDTFGVTLKAPAESVAPGSSVTATVTIHNRGETMDEYTIRMPDLPESWVRINRPRVSLMPGVREDVTIVIKPDRNFEATAGERQIAVSVVSRESRREVRALGTLNIRSFEQLDAKIQPARHKRDFRVTVANKGNVPVAYHLVPSDPNDELKFELESETVELGPGEEKTVPIRAKSRKRSLFGQPRALRFSVAVTPEGMAQEKRTVDAVVSVRPPIRHWRYGLGAIVVAVLLGGAAFTYSSACPSGWPGCGSKASTPETPTPGPSPTAAASPTAAPNVLGVGGQARVVNSSGSEDEPCLNVRENPTIPSGDPRANVIGQMCNDTIVSIVDGSVDAEGFRWWKVEGMSKDGVQVSGWAAEKSLESGAISWLVPAGS
ncbi:MAG: hypothetical protein Kow0010_06320 [Dehalococcoidia bacterium]